MRRALMIGRTAISCVALSAVGTAAHAQSVSGQEPIVLDEVNVEGQVSDGGSDDSGKSGVRPRNGTLGPLGKRKLQDTPYSISVIDKTLIENQQATTLPDLLKYMPSTQMEARGGPDVGRPQSRGMQGTPVFNNRLDGLNIVATSAQPIEMYERLEVVHGLAGAYFGPASPGGLFNFTRKRPTQEFYNRINTGYTSDGIWLAHGDFGGHLADGMFGYRINVLGERGEGFVEGSDLDRALFSGAFDINLGENTKIELNASHYKFDKFGFPGGFTYTNAMTLPEAPDPTKVGYGQTFSGYGLEDNIVGGRIRHEFNESWNFTAGVQYQEVSRWLPTVANALMDNNGNYTNSITPSVSGQFQVTSNVATLNGELFTGAVKHDVYVGTTGVTWENHGALNAAPTLNLDRASIDNPIQWLTPAGLDRDGPRYKSFSNSSQSVMIGDTITFNEQWSAILSGSYTWFDIKNYSRAGAVTDTYSNGGFSPSVALMFKPVANVTTYVAYADSLQSGSAAPVGAANEGQVLSPERSQQIEAGIKADLGGLDATLAIFQIERPFAFAGDDNIYRVQGDQVNKGIELGLQGELFDNFNVYGGITLMDPKLKNTGNPATSDKDVVGVPKVQANLFMEYFIDAVPGLAASANVHYTGRRAGNNINSFKVDDYTTLDLALRYERQLTKDTSATFKFAVNNVFDKNYWMSIFPASIDGGSAGRNNAFLGTPREFKLSASVKF